MARRRILPYRCVVCGTARTWHENSACNRCQRERLAEMEGQEPLRNLIPGMQNNELSDGSSGTMKGQEQTDEIPY